jgi:hypothetical protein
MIDLSGIVCVFQIDLLYLQQINKPKLTKYRRLNNENLQCKRKTGCDFNQ